MHTDTAPTGQDVRNKAEETASTIAREAQETATVQLTSQKERAASTLNTIAQTLRDSGQNLRGEQPQIASLTDEAARRVEDVSNYVRQHEVRDLVREAENFARREPALFLGGAFAIGFLAARFLKASSPSSDRYAQGSYEGTGSPRYAGYSWQPTTGSEFGPTGSDIGSAGSGYGSAGGIGTAGSIGTVGSTGLGVAGGTAVGSTGGGTAGSTYEDDSTTGLAGEPYGGTVGYGDTERYGVGTDIAAVGSEYDTSSGVDTAIDQVDDVGDDNTNR